MKQSQTAYLARPGFPGLIEVQQRDELNDRPLFVDKISIPLEPKLQGLIAPIGLVHILKPSADEVSFSLGGTVIKMNNFV